MKWELPWGHMESGIQPPNNPWAEATTLQPPPYNKSQALVKPKPRPRLLPVKIGEVSACTGEVDSGLVNQMEETVGLIDHLKREKPQLDRRGVDKKTSA